MRWFFFLLILKFSFRWSPGWWCRCICVLDRIGLRVTDPSPSEPRFGHRAEIHGGGGVRRLLPYRPVLRRRCCGGTGGGTIDGGRCGRATCHAPPPTPRPPPNTLARTLVSHSVSRVRAPAAGPSRVSAAVVSNRAACRLVRPSSRRPDRSRTVSPPLPGHGPTIRRRRRALACACPRRVFCAAAAASQFTGFAPPPPRTPFAVTLPVPVRSDTRRALYRRYPVYGISHRLV